MASRKDLERARTGARHALDDLDRLQRLREDCNDPALRTMLDDIGRSKSGQTARLLGWLSLHDPDMPGMHRPSGGEPASDGAVAEADEALDAAESEPANDAEAATASEAERVAAPATTEGGVVVSERRDVTPDLLVLKLPRPADFNFLPGQSVKVGLEDVRRSYSIVSAPHEPWLEFFIELFPGGRMSEHLRRLAPGDRLTLDAPKGSFLLDERFSDHLMVATVTGINPFVSMLRDYIHSGRGGHRFHVLHGASYQDEFGYRQELEAMAAAHPELITYVPTVSRPEEPANAGWQGSTGRVDTQVDNYIDQAGLDVGGTMVYACGHSGMIHAVEQRCRPRGFQIKTEDYD